jgi:hypothetical protein
VEADAAALLPKPTDQDAFRDKGVEERVAVRLSPSPSGYEDFFISAHKDGGKIFQTAYGHAHGCARFESIIGRAHGIPLRPQPRPVPLSRILAPAPLTRQGAVSAPHHVLYFLLPG